MFRTGVQKGMKLCTAVKESCGYKDTLRSHCYYAPLAKYFTVCITYQPTLVLNLNQTNSLVEDDKNHQQAKLPVLNWHNYNRNITTVEMLIVLLQ